MSRSGYSDDWGDPWPIIRWRGAVTSAIRGKKGQAFLQEMLAAMDALPEKRLISWELRDDYDPNSVCAMGAVGRARGLDMSKIDPEDHESVASEFDVAQALACEILWLNDEGSDRKETPEQRFDRVRQWIVKRIREAP